MPKNLSWKGEFLCQGVWNDNAIRLATQAEAEAYASNLFMRWTIPTEKRVVESEDPVNYTADEHGAIKPLPCERHGKAHCPQCRDLVSDATA